jgi:cell division protease FtsH
LIHDRQFSEATAKLIDDEVEALITEAADRARIVIKQNLKQLESLKDALLAKETIDAPEVIKLLSNSKLPEKAKLY